MMKRNRQIKEGRQKNKRAAAFRAKKAKMEAGGKKDWQLQHNTYCTVTKHNARATLTKVYPVPGISKKERKMRQKIVPAVPSVPCLASSRTQERARAKWKPISKKCGGKWPVYSRFNLFNCKIKKHM